MGTFRVSCSLKPPRRVARGRLALVGALLLACLASCLATVVRAESSTPLPPLLSGTENDDAANARFFELLAAREGQRGEVSRVRLEAFRRAVAILQEARNRAAALQEGEALASLARVRELLEDLADVPGAARWWAELEATTVVVAHQAGRLSLARQALERLASLAPGRELLPGEAPPESIRWAASERARRRARVPGRWRVTSHPPGASVSLDDEPLGHAPLTARIAPGWHVLRVHAPGYLSWGRVVRVEEGAEETLRIRLVPTPALRAARRVRSLLRGEPLSSERTRDAILGALSYLDRLGHPVRWVHLHEWGGGWAAFGCDGRGCVGPVRAASRQEARASVLGVLAGARRLTFAGLWRRWEGLFEMPAAPPLDAPPRKPPVARKLRWPLWVALGAAAVGVGVGAWWWSTARQDTAGQRPIRLRFEPGVPVPSLSP